MKSRPRMLMCPLCGREFGTKSLPIHYPQCTKKWLDQENLKPAHERRPLPVLPEAMANAMAGGLATVSAKQIQAFNEQMVHSFETESLHHCDLCGRSFNDKAFKKHQELCTPYKPFRPKGTGLGSQSLSTKLAPGKISGTQHKQASLPTPSSTDDCAKAAHTVPASAWQSSETASHSPRSGPFRNATPSKPALKALSSVTPAKDAAVGNTDLKSARIATKPVIAVSAQPPLTARKDHPELPPEVKALAEEVCLEAVGVEGTAALLQYLRSQHVRALGDIQFLHLDWLLAELRPAGLSPLLLNKFLTLAQQRGGRT